MYQTRDVKTSGRESPKFDLSTLTSRFWAVLESGGARPTPTRPRREPFTIDPSIQGCAILTNRQAREIWETVLGRLQVQITRPSFETWLKNTVGLGESDGGFVVGTPNAFVSEMLETRMYSLIASAMERVLPGPTEIRFVVVPAESLSAPPASPPDPYGSPSTGSEPAPYPIRGRAAVSPQAAPERDVALNADYTFDTFIVGKSNELAHAAAVAVSDSPGAVYNPLVIHSDVGLGKTHLLHAIGARIRAKGLSLIYSTTEEFTNAYIRAIREGRTEEFRARYRSTDALLLDDIQFLIGKEQTQEGFFHTFNALHMSNRQILITSDRPVTDLTLLEPRVRSRLTGGLVADIQPPDLETRLAILRAKADLLRHDVPSEVVQFLGERVHSNIRELEGALNRVVVYAQITRAPITLELVKRVIADVLGSGSRRRSPPDEIIDAVSQYFNVPSEALRGPRGKKDVALARQVAMYLLREEAGLGPTQIGRLLGGRDHSTVIKNCAKIAQQLDADTHLRRNVVNIRQSLSSATISA